MIHDTLGQLVALMAASPIHREWTVSDFGRLIVPPLLLGQHAIVRVNSRVVAWGSWALLDEEAEEGYVSGTRKLQASDWRIGDRLWIVDAVAPWGHARDLTAAMHAELTRRGMAGRTIRFRRNKGGERRYSRLTV